MLVITFVVTLLFAFFILPMSAKEKKNVDFKINIPQIWK
jgi:hypothetical protein